MSSFKIADVSSTVKEWDSQHGPMKTYRVIFDDDNTIVQLNQKASTPAPKVGDSIEGTVDMSGDYGPKFVKAFAPKGGGGGSRPMADPKTMYVSYAKDIAIALIAHGVLPSGDKFEAEFNAAINFVGIGGETLNKGKGADEAKF